MLRSRFIKQWLILLSFMIGTHQLKAQWHKWNLGGGIGSLTYYGDLSDKFVNANLQSLGYHFYVESALSTKSGVYWRLESVNGHLLGSDRAPGGWLNNKSEYFDRSLNFKASIHDVNTSFVLYFGHNTKKQRPPFLNAYLRAGIGVGYFDVNGDIRAANGDFYYYWSDGTIRSLPQNDPYSFTAQIVERDYTYETNLRKQAVEKSYNRFKWQIPVALGLKMRLGSAAAFILEAQYTYAMTDYLDNVGDEKIRNGLSPEALVAADPAGVIGNQPRSLGKSTGLNDSYLYVSAGLNFNLGKVGQSKFKTPVFYPKTYFHNTEDSLINHLDTVSIAKEALSDTSLKTKDNFVSKEQVDSIFFGLFQKYHQQWIQIDTLMNGQEIDSVAIVRVPELNHYYLAKYYQIMSIDSLLKTPQAYLLKVDTLKMDLNHMAIIRDSVSYQSSETKGILQQIPIEKIDSQMLYRDSVLYQIQILKQKVQQLQDRIEKDSVALSPKDTLAQTTLILNDTGKVLDIKPEIYTVNVPNEYLDSLDLIQKLSTSNKEKHANQQDSILPKITFTTDSLIPVDTSIKVTLDSVKLHLPSPSNQAQTDTTYDKKIQELKQRLAEIDSVNQAQDKLLQKMRKKDSIRANDTIFQVKNIPGNTTQSATDSVSEQQMEQLKQKLKSLEKIQIQDSLKSPKRIQATSPKEKTLKTSQAYFTDSLQNAKIQELKNQLVATKTSSPEVTTTIQHSKKSQKQSDKVSKLVESKQASSDLNKKLLELQRQMNQQERANNFTKKTVTPSTIVISNNGNQQELARRISNLETQLKSQTAKNTSANTTDWEARLRQIEQEQDLNKRIALLNGLQSELNQRGNIQPVANMSEQNQPASQKKQAEDTAKTVLSKVDTVSKAIYQSDSTLIQENKRLRSQIDRIQKNQDSLFVVLNKLLAKEKQIPPTKPIDTSKEQERQATELRNKLIQGLLSQPVVKVFFAVGKSTLAGQYKNSIDVIANQLKKFPELKVELEGFADPTGNAKLNMQLSEKRAKSVKDYLQTVHHISEERISVLPIGQENDSKNLSYSRRVEIHLTR